MVSSGSAVSQKAVKPRMSQNRTPSSARWLFRMSSDPVETTLSATAAGKKRFSRAMRLISPTCASTRAPSSAFSVSSALNCRVLSMAITACAAKPTTNSISLCVNGWTSQRARPKAPIASPSRIRGIAIKLRMPSWSTCATRCASPER